MRHQSMQHKNYDECLKVKGDEILEAETPKVINISNQCKNELEMLRSEMSLFNNFIQAKTFEKFADYVSDELPIREIDFMKLDDRIDRTSEVKRTLIATHMLIKDCVRILNESRENFQHALNTIEE